MTKVPQSRETPAGAAHRQLVVAVEQFLRHWRSVYREGGPRDREIRDASDLAERVLRLSAAHPMPAIDAHLRYLAWSVGDLDGVLYEELTSPTSTMAFPSDEFTRRHHAFNAGFWGKFQCVRSDRRFRLGCRVDPEASLELVCDWVRADWSEVRRLEDDLCGLAHCQVAGSEKVLMQACRSTNCLGFSLSLSGEPICSRYMQRVPYGLSRFPSMSRGIPKFAAPEGCGIEFEMSYLWDVLHGERGQVVTALRNHMALRVGNASPPDAAAAPSTAATQSAAPSSAPVT